MSKEVTEARALLAAATPGPWRTTEDSPRPLGLCAAADPRRSLLMVDADGMACVDSDADAALIAAAPRLLAALVERCERLDSENRALIAVRAEDFGACAKEYFRAERAEAEVERLRAALRKYGQHSIGCPWRKVDPGGITRESCVCGFNDAALAGPKEGP